ncbi:hypothetical protein [Paraburkholderia acidisoli]|uniref:Uncharacterized protein n=1 Tax=Paraburkholderia acidisoli TaxID=2571748 RepID=A0A7Z2GRU8_9BURK|nr:hypothetical protein [Paraburkholderia acidisoli]QGZ66595.1 hypothetical protein FAZ98_33090 [Paraburkholderia acidisoli]
MDVISVKLTQPLVRADSLWFSAYEFGWGYRAFEIPGDVAKNQLGAADGSAQKLTLAFGLGRQTIAKAVESVELDYRGERIVLRAGDLA